MIRKKEKRGVIGRPASTFSISFAAKYPALFATLSAFNSAGLAHRTRARFAAQASSATAARILEVVLS
jgi:hypothetical protein